MAVPELAMPRSPRPAVSHKTLAARVREHLRDERINSEEEVNAELNLMTHVELMETISYVLDLMLVEEGVLKPEHPWPASASR
jgi:hypothetical protein